jgi:hypothetical protein
MLRTADKRLAVRCQGEIIINWEAIGAIGELFGGVVVVITFLYLGRQIQLSTKQQKLDSHRAMAELQIGSNRIFYDPTLTRMVVRAINNWDAGTFDELNVTRQWITDTVTHYQAMHEMWRSGAIDDITWAAEEDYLVKELLATSGGRGFWRENSNLFSQSFIDRIEPLIADEPLGMFKLAYERLEAEDNGADT